MLTLPVLHTDRLVLRVPGPDDAAALTAFVVQNRHHLRSSEPERPSDYFTEPYWAAELSTLASRVLAEEVVPFILVPRAGTDAGIIGRCTFSGIARGPFQAAFLGYGLASQHVGQGFMFEALQAAITYAFQPLKLHRIMANYVPTNERSARLLSRLGFEREGYARAYLRLDGRWQDHVLTALTNDHWTPA